MTSSVTIIATGSANTASVIAAFDRLGVSTRTAKTPADVRNADRVVLPGVGAFGPAMRRIDEQGMRDALVERITDDRPTLAICLGLQLLADGSEESPGTAGLGVVDGTVTRLPEDLVVPHLGWNEVTPVSDDGLLAPGWAYFANSYRLPSIPEGWSGAWTDYGSGFVSALERGNVLACQFHPELSGEWGARLLARWLECTGRAS